MKENKEDATIQVIVERISSLHEDVTDLRNDIDVDVFCLIFVSCCILAVTSFYIFFLGLI